MSLECGDGSDLFGRTDSMGIKPRCNNPVQRPDVDREFIHDGLRGIEDLLTGAAEQEQSSLLDDYKEADPNCDPELDFDCPSKVEEIIKQEIEKVLSENLSRTALKKLDPKEFGSSQGALGLVKVLNNIIAHMLAGGLGKDNMMDLSDEPWSLETGYDKPEKFAPGVTTSVVKNPDIKED